MCTLSTLSKNHTQDLPKALGTIKYFLILSAI